MGYEPCGGCGDRVRIAGGIAGIWGGDRATTGGVTLELGDGTEHFLCFACIDRLPDHPTAADVEALADQ